MLKLFKIGQLQKQKKISDHLTECKARLENRSLLNTRLTQVNRYTRRSTKRIKKTKRLEEKTVRAKRGEQKIF